MHGQRPPYCNEPVTARRQDNNSEAWLTLVRADINIIVTNCFILTTYLVITRKILEKDDPGSRVATSMTALMSLTQRKPVCIFVRINTFTDSIEIAMNAT